MSAVETKDLRGEVERIKRVSDTLITAHSSLREQFARKALLLDATILAFTVWITSVVFVEPKIGLSLTPFHFDPQVWIGLLSILTLFLSIVQLRVDWKGRADAHQRSCDMYSRVKAECRYLLESTDAITRERGQNLFSQYELSGQQGLAVPEGQFLKLKKKHLTKVAISKMLDRRPGSSIALLRARLWWRANIARRVLDDQD